METLAFEERVDGDGVGGGAVVVCLPMFSTTRGFTASMLEPAFAGTGTRRVYVDLPGHGESPGTPSATSEAVLAAVVSFVRVRYGGPVLFAGCSYGGYLAAAVARRWPGEVGGLLLVCPGVRIAGERDLPPAGEPGDDEVGWLDAVEPRFADHLGVALGRRTSAVARHVSRALVGGTGGDEEFRERLRGGAYALADEDEARTFGGPVTVVTGRRDRVVGYADQFRRLERYPRGTFAAVDGAGHYLPFETPELLRGFVHDWLRRCSPTAG